MISHARWCGTFQIQLTSHCMHFVRAADDDYYYYITLMMMARMAMTMGAMTMEVVTIQLQQTPMPVMTTRTIRETTQSLTTKTWRHVSIRREQRLLNNLGHAIVLYYLVSVVCCSVLSAVACCSVECCTDSWLPQLLTPNCTPRQQQWSHDQLRFLW